jgi:lipopolysaccharide/colanic/teichoic acid biosynthesis glycosyltransferase
VLKRAFDLIISVAALVLLTPLLLRRRPARAR